MHRMDVRSREQYLKALLGRYLKVRKRGKSVLLDEYCRNTGMARKSVLRKIAGLLKGESLPLSLAAQQGAGRGKAPGFLDFLARPKFVTMLVIGLAALDCPYCIAGRAALSTAGNRRPSQDTGCGRTRSADCHRGR